MAPVVDHARFEATLPERTAATVTSVEMLDVTLPGVAEQAPVMAAVLIVDEDRASVDAALGDMKGNAGQEKTGLSWHGAGGEAAG